MKLGNRFFTALFVLAGVLSCGTLYAADTPVELDCLEEIGTDSSFGTELEGIFSSTTELNNTIIGARKQELYTAIMNRFFQHCTNYADWNKVADNDHFAFNFAYKGKNYHIKVNSDALFKLHETPNHIFFAPTRERMNELSIGQTIGKNSLPDDENYLKECQKDLKSKIGTIVSQTDLHIHPNGLDFLKGILFYRFPIRNSIKGSSLIEYSNYLDGRKKTAEIASALANSRCKSLLLYHVFYDKNTKNITVASEPIVIGQ